MSEFPEVLSFPEVLLKTAIVNVVKAAFDWADVESNESDDQLLGKVQILKEQLDAMPNRPTGFIFKRQWLNIEPGWFVQTPKGDWLEVITIGHSQGRTAVKFRINGAERIFQYDSDGPEVPVKMGTKNNPKARALEAVRRAFPESEILEVDWS